MASAFCLMLRGRRDGFEAERNRVSPGCATGSIIFAARRPRGHFRSLELNDHTFFNLDLKSLFDCHNTWPQLIEITAISCHKYTDVRFFSAGNTALPED
jgi:hypothetical protein